MFWVEKVCEELVGGMLLLLGWGALSDVLRGLRGKRRLSEHNFGCIYSFNCNSCIVVGAELPIQYSLSIM